MPIRQPDASLRPADSAWSRMVRPSLVALLPALVKRQFAGDGFVGVDRDRGGEHECLGMDVVGESGVGDVRGDRVHECGRAADEQVGVGESVDVLEVGRGEVLTGVFGVAAGVEQPQVDAVGGGQGGELGSVGHVGGGAGVVQEGDGSGELLGDQCTQH